MAGNRVDRKRERADMTGPRKLQNMRQMTAITFPCERADKSPDRKYWQQIGNWSTILTINK